MSVKSIHSGDPIASPSARSVKSGSQSDFASVLNSSIHASDAPLDSIFEAASQKYSVPVQLLKAVAKAESNFNASETSPCGAMGIMQLMPDTAKSLGVSDAYDPEENIMGGAKYLSQLLSQFDGSTELAVAAYNAGPGNVTKYDGIPPFEETRNYVEKVLGYCGDNLPTDTLSATSDASASLQSAASAVVSDGYAGKLSPLLLMRIYQMRFLDVTDDDQNVFL